MRRVVLSAGLCATRTPYQLLREMIPKGLEPEKAMPDFSTTRSLPFGALQYRHRNGLTLVWRQLGGSFFAQLAMEIDKEESAEEQLFVIVYQHDEDRYINTQFKIVDVKQVNIYRQTEKDTQTHMTFLIEMVFKRPSCPCRGVDHPMTPFGKSRTSHRVVFSGDVDQPVPGEVEFGNLKDCALAMRFRVQYTYDEVPDVLVRALLGDVATPVCNNNNENRNSSILPPPHSPPGVSPSISQILEVNTTSPVIRAHPLDYLITGSNFVYVSYFSCPILSEEQEHLIRERYHHYRYRFRYRRRL